MFMIVTDAKFNARMSPSKVSRHLFKELRIKRENFSRKLLKEKRVMSKQ